MNLNLIASADTCTLAIAMMTTDIDRPGQSVRPWYAADIATFDEIWVAANSINNWCTGRSGYPGWTSVGERSLSEFRTYDINATLSKV